MRTTIAAAASLLLLSGCAGTPDDDQRPAADATAHEDLDVVEEDEVAGGSIPDGTACDNFAEYLEGLQAGTFDDVQQERLDRLRLLGSMEDTDAGRLAAQVGQLESRDEVESWIDDMVDECDL